MRDQPLLTLIITETGEVQAAPGRGFGDKHVELLVAAVGAVADVTEQHNH